MKLIRNRFQADGITGRLLDEAGDQIAVTMEHSYDCKPKLPAGTYTCKRGMHTLHSHPKPFETFEILGVPGHTGILFHWGNWNGDSDGCVILGRTCTGSERGCMVTNSWVTFDKFMIDLEGVNVFSLIVEDEKEG